MNLCQSSTNSTYQSHQRKGSFNKTSSAGSQQQYQQKSDYQNQGYRQSPTRKHGANNYAQGGYQQQRQYDESKRSDDPAEKYSNQ